MLNTSTNWRNHAISIISIRGGKPILTPFHVLLPIYGPKAILHFHLREVPTKFHVLHMPSW